MKKGGETKRRWSCKKVRDSGDGGNVTDILGICLSYSSGTEHLISRKEVEPAPGGGRCHQCPLCRHSGRQVFGTAHHLAKWQKQVGKKNYEGTFSQ